MIFSEGDFIVLGIVVLVLFLFRRLDKNSKSLEKVRRYADKVKGELDKIFHEKEEQMKDLSINFEVQEKTYREILKRIQAAREELQGREESLNDLMGRLEGFDDRINGLYQLTGKVDENMIRLREESEYVDSLGLRLKDSKKNVENLEKGIAQISEGFRSVNQKNLEKIKTSIVNDMQARMDILSGELNHNGQELDRFYTELKECRQSSETFSSRTLDQLKKQMSDLAGQASLESEELWGTYSQRLEDLEKDYQERLQNAAKRGMELEDQVFEKLDQKINEKQQSLEENWFKGMGDLKEEVFSQVEEIRQFVEQGETSLNMFRESQQQTMNENLQRLENLTVNLSHAEERMEGISDSVAEIRHEAINTLQGSMGELSQVIERELDQKKRDLEEQFTAAQQSGEEALNHLQNQVAGISETIDQELQSKKEQLDDRFTDINESGTGMARMLEELDAQIIELRDSTDRLRTDSARQLGEEIDSLRKGLDDLRQESLASLHSGIQEHQQEFISLLDQRSKGYEDDMDRFSSRLEQLKEEMEHNQQDAIESVRSNVEQFQSEMSGMMTQRKDTVTHQMEEWHHELLTKLDQYTRELEQKGLSAHQDLEERIQGYEKDLSGKYDRFQSLWLELESYEDNLQSSLNGLESKNQSRWDEFLNSQNRDIENRMGEWKSLAEQKYEHLNQELQQWQSGISDKLKQVEDLNRDQQIALSEKITGNMQDILNETQASLYKDYGLLKDQAQQMADQVSSRLAGTDEEIGRIRDYLEEQLVHYQETADLHFTETEGSLIGFKERTSSEMNSIKLSLNEMENRIEVLKDSTLESAQEHFGAVERTLLEQMEQKSRDLSDHLIQWEGKFDDQLDLLGQRYGKQLDDVESSIAEKIDRELEQYKDQITSQYRETTDQAEQFSQRIEQVLQGNQDQLDSYRNDWGIQIAQMQEQSRLFQQGITQDLDDLQVVKTQYSGNIDEFKNKLELELGGIRNQMESHIQLTAERLNELSAEFEQEAMKGLEHRQKEYEQLIIGRFDKLENLTQDLDQLEKSLRLSLNDQEERIMNEMGHFRQDQRDQQELEREHSNQRLGDIRRIISQVEGELSQLKTQAYENVSEKLQLFEDDFFSDLKTREQAMRDSFEQWQKTIDLQLEDLNNQSARDREELERNYQTQFKRKFNDIQAKVIDQLDKFQEQVQSFQNNTLQQIEGSEQDFVGFRQGVKEELKKIRSESMVHFQQEFQDYQLNIQEEMARSDKEIGQKLDSLSSEIDSSRNELTTLVNSSRSDMTQWQNRVLVQLKNQQAELDSDIGDFRNQVVDTIKELQEDFSSQKEDLILASSQDRALLKSDLQEISESVDELKDELATRSTQSLNLLKEEADRFLLEFQSRSREVQAESDERVKTIRQTLQDSRERMDQHQKQLHNQLEESYDVLSGNLEELKNQQQEFIAQTHIFEQAENLKNSLEEDIEELRGRMAHLERSRQEIAPMEEEYNRVLKTYQDVASRMNQFFSEKQKIDLLDNKVARINNLSEAIDVKLEQIDGTNDMIQEYMVRMRQLEDLHGDMTKRFMGLEKKASIIDATTSSVEKNLQILNHIEKGLKSIGSDLDPMKNDLNTIKQSNQQMLERKETVDQLVDTLNNLDKTMAELEERQKRMDKAREWLASTETRMEAIGREAQEKVKLLGSLIQKEGKKPVRQGGSPDMNTREMVIKLARQGWNSEEISRSVKLSRGEVELILELSPPEE